MGVGNGIGLINCMLQMESDPLHKFMLSFVFGHGMSSILDI